MIANSICKVLLKMVVNAIRKLQIYDIYDDYYTAQHFEDILRIML